MKRIILLTMMALLFFGIAPTLSTRAESSNTASDLYYDEESDTYIFRTTDKLKQSNTYYRTVGFTISRCKPGIQEKYLPEEFVIVNIRDLDAEEGIVLDTQEQLDGTVVTTWAINKSYVFSCIEKEHPEWATELFEEIDLKTWLKFDAIMVIYVNENPQGSLIGHIPIGNVYGNVSGLQTPEDLQNEMRRLGFSTASLKAIPYHFNKYLPYSLWIEPEEPPYEEDAVKAPSSEFVEKIGKPQPEYYVWNSSNKFDIAKGIPSSEKVINHVLVDEWYGTADLGLHKEPKSWKFNSTITWYTIRYTYNSQGKHKHTVWHSETYYPVVQREAWYYYLQDCNFYVYDKTDVKNGAFPNGQINYINEHPVSINFSVNGALNPEHVSTWIPSNSGNGTHVIWNDSYNANLGICDGGNSKNAAKKIANQRANQVISNLPWWGKSKNDLLEINNKKYLDDVEIIHKGNQ